MRPKQLKPPPLGARLRLLPLLTSHFPRELQMNFSRNVIKGGEIVHYKVAQFLSFTRPGSF
jgi:hypothetical protein